MDTEKKSGGRNTPGPWQVSGCRFKWRESVSNQILDSHAVGPDSDAVALVFYTPKYHAEQIANARLIAAAPTLLEAVQRARRHAMNIGIDCGSYVEQLDAAIAKAVSP